MSKFAAALVPPSYTETTFRRVHSTSEEGVDGDDDEEEEEDDDYDMSEQNGDLFDEKVRSVNDLSILCSGISYVSTHGAFLCL